MNEERVMVFVFAMWVVGVVVNLSIIGGVAWVIYKLLGHFGVV